MSSSPPRTEQADQPAAAVAETTPATAAADATVPAAPANGVKAEGEQSASADAAASAAAPASSTVAPPVLDPAAERRMAENATAIPGADGKLVIPTKLFVGALSNNVDDSRLRACFEPYGTIVECKVQRDKFTQQSRNFGSEGQQAQAQRRRRTRAIAARIVFAQLFSAVCFVRV